MSRIVIHIQPFVFTQSIIVYNEKGIQIYTKETSLPTLSEAIKELAIKYNIHQVDLTGNKYFTNKVQKDLIKFAKYSNLNISITVH